MINILQLTDTHLFGDAEGSLYNINTRTTLNNVIHHIKQTIDNVDAIMLTGDLVHDESRAGYLYLKTLIESLGYPAYYLPGNHDDPALMYEIFDNCATNNIVSFTAKEWTIILLDSSIPGKVEGELSEKNLHRLEKILADNPERNTLIALHHHIVDVKSNWLDALNLRNHAQLTSMLTKYPGVKLVINGHVHQEVDKQKNGIRYLSTPATCFQFAVQSKNGGIDNRPPAYRHLMLHDNGSCDTTVHYVTSDE